MAFLVLLPAALLITEGSVRLLKLREIGAPRHDVIETPSLPARMRPNFSGQFMGLPLVTNSYGFRDEPYIPLLPEAGEFRILALGDSVGIGLGLEASQHYTQLVEESLNRPSAPHRYRVINAAGQGYSPSSYLVYLLNEGLRFQPHMVIVQIELCNDVTDEALLRWQQHKDELFPSAVRGGRYVVGWDGNLLGTVSYGPFFLEKTYTHVLLTRRVLNLLFWLFPQEPFHSRPVTPYFYLEYERFVLNEPRLEAGWDRLFGALQKTHHLLEGEGVSFLVMILPSRYMFEPVSDYQRQAVAFFGRALEEAERRRIPHVGFADSIGEGGGARLYIDFAHPTAEGNRIIAESLSGRLRPLVE